MIPPVDDPTPPAPGEPAPATGGDEPAAWAELLRRWGDPEAHRGYLARFPDLDGLTTAARRYREVLAARPGDAVALAMKAEIVKRATVVGLASLPRTAPSGLTGGRAKRWAVILLASWLGSAAAWFLYRALTSQP
jgi:hypothetical protein